MGNSGKFCFACGMPLVNKEDFASGDMGSDFCVHCTDQNGKVKSCDEIFQGGVNFFLSRGVSDPGTAERLVRKNMRRLPYWRDKNNAVLEGEIATDDEFARLLKMLSAK